MALLCAQFQHDLIPQAHPQEEDAQLARDLIAFRGGMFKLFQEKIDAILAAHPGETDTNKRYAQVRKALDACPEVKAVHAQRGVLQDRLWAKAKSDIDRDRQRLEAAYQTHDTGIGRLDLDPNLVLPAHQLKAEIHRMPGGYLTVDPSSFISGTVYDHGTFLYGRGWLGPLNDELGQTLIHNVLKRQYPDLQPQKILDLGCAVGHSTLPYAAAYPKAQVWGVDVSAPLLRQAIARARSLNVAIDFVQQNAESTGFADGSFDLVVSHILLHEIPNVARRRVFAESYRLLKPGGVMVHLESQMFLQPATLLARYFRDTEVWANSEPYLGSSKFEDFTTYALEAGFAPEAFHIQPVPGYYAAKSGDDTARWLTFCGVK